jgi:hypothetical protein
MTVAGWPRHGVSKTGERTWTVPSKSHHGDLHTVEWHTAPREGIWFTCSCPAGESRGRMGAPRYEPACRHVRLVAVAEADDGVPARPTPPPNIGALID